MNKDIVVLIPIYDPDEKITKDFLKELKMEFSNIVIVNDGSKKEHDKFFKKLENDYPVLKHHINLGKGRAIKNGINYILNNYNDASVIVTADCDGQHSVKDIKKCALESKKYSDSLILGVRDFSKDNVPLRSRFGNKMTRNIMNTLYGQKISDTQTGLRAMSYAVAKRLLQVFGERYEYETNVLIACKDLSISIKEVTINTIYINDNKTSHFNPVKDSIKIYKLFFKPILVCLFFYILELLLFNKLIQLNGDVIVTVILASLIVKLASSVFILIINKHVNYLYCFISYVIVTSLLLLIQSHLLLIKVLGDILLLILYLL